MSKKHFKATHKESGEVIKFDLEDITTFTCKGKDLGLWDKKECNVTDLNFDEMEDWLNDYHLQYLHNGEYHDYADERSEVKEGVE